MFAVKLTFKLRYRKVKGLKTKATTKRGFLVDDLIYDGLFKQSSERRN
jgi:hypothetical protein